MAQRNYVGLLAVLLLMPALGAAEPKPTVCEVETFRLTAPAAATDAYGCKAVVFPAGEGDAGAEGVITLAQDRTGFWVRVYFDGVNASVGDANSVFLSLDGAGKRTLSSDGKDCWLWYRVNTPLKAGKHVFAFQRREAPVYLDCIAFYEGDDAKKTLAAVRPPVPLALPFDLENEFLVHEAPSFGQWDAYGARASEPRIGMPERKIGSPTPLLEASARGPVVLWRKSPIQLCSDSNWVDRPTCVEVILRTDAQLKVACLLRDGKGNLALQPMTESVKDARGRHFISIIGWAKGTRLTQGGQLAMPVRLLGLSLVPADGEVFEATVVDVGLVNPVELRLASEWQAEGGEELTAVRAEVEVVNHSNLKCSVPLRSFCCPAADVYGWAGRTADAEEKGSVRWLELDPGARQKHEVRIEAQGDGFCGVCIGVGTPVGCLVSKGKVAPWQAGPPRPTVTNVSHCPTGFGVPGCPPCVVGDYVYLPAGEGDLTVLDVRDKTRPVIASIVHTWHFWHRIFEFRDRLFFKPSRAGSAFFFDDGSDPYHPGIARKSALSGSLMWMDEKMSVAVTGTAEGLVVWDMTDLYEPERKYTLGGVSGFCKLPGRMVAVSVSPKAREMVVIGIKPDGRLEEVTRFRNEYDDEGNPARIAAANSRLLLLMRGSHMVAYDLKDPAKPVRRYDGPLEIEQPSHVRGMIAEGDTLYMSDARYWASGHWVHHNSAPSALYAFDLRPIYTARPFPVPKEAKPLQDDAPKPPLVDEAGGEDGELFLDSVETEGCLRKIPRLWHVVETLPTYYGAIAVSGEYLYVSDYDFGVHVYKLKGKEPPEKVGKHITAGEGHFGTLLGDYYCMAQTFGGSVTIIDVSDIKNPRRRGYFWDGEFTMYKLAGRGKALYVPKHIGRVKIVDISDPDHPKEVGMFPLTGRALTSTRVAVLGDRAFVMTATDIEGEAATRIFQYDIAEPLKPRLTRQLALPGPVRGFTPQMCVRSGAIYVLDAHNHRLYTIDLAADGSMALKGTLESVLVSTAYNMEYPGALTASRGYVYVAGVPGLTKDPETGKMIATSARLFHIIDARDLAAPKLVKTFDPKARIVGWANFICDMESTDEFLIAGNYGRLLVYDIRQDPTQPTPIGSGQTAYNWTIGAIKDKLIYSCGLNGLYVLRIWP